ncbi:53_t:CDS:2, partial [Racocetra persica]
NHVWDVSHQNQNFYWTNGVVDDVCIRSLENVSVAADEQYGMLIIMKWNGV